MPHLLRLVAVQKYESFRLCHSASENTKNLIPQLEPVERQKVRRTGYLGIKKGFTGTLSRFNNAAIRGETVATLIATNAS